MNDPERGGLSRVRLTNLFGLWCRSEETMKQEKTISKIVEQYDGDWPPSDAVGAMAWFQAKLDDIPDEFRSTAKIELDTTSRYDSSYATIEFSYVRFETDEEEAQREQQAAARPKNRRAEEWSMLAALQAKCGAPKT